MEVFVASLCTLLLGIILTLAVRAMAYRVGIVAAPRPDRWHQKPTAMLGGVANYAAFFAGYFIFGPERSDVYPILAAGTFLFLTGLVDDIIHLRPYTKLAIQFAAAAVTVFFGLQLPWTGYQALNALITIFWLVGITNAFNLLDNMDGLAGGVSVIACVFLAITFWLNGQMAEAIIPALLAGAVLGFLVFNFNPASIFMGDSGSMFIGFSLAGIALLSDYGRTRNLASVLLTPVLIMLIPIFDTTMVTVVRKLSGRPVSQGGRDHTSHRLVTIGMSERRAVIYIYLFAAISGLLALMLRWTNTEVDLLLIPVFALAIIFLGFYLGDVRVYKDELPTPGNTVIAALAGFAYKRRIIEIVLDVLLVALAYLGAFVLRFDGNIPNEQMAIYTRTVPLVLGVQMLFFLSWGVYGGLWRYAGMNDLVTIAEAVLTGTVTSSFIVFAVYGFQGPSRAVFVLNGLLLFVFTSGSRLSFRMLHAVLTENGHTHPEAHPVFIYGAGDGGELLIRELLNNDDYGYMPVGFIDDDARKTGKSIHGYRIFHSRELPDLINKHNVGEVLVSSAKVPESKLVHLRRLGVNLRRMRIRIE